MKGNTMQWPPGIDRKIFLRDYWQKKPLLIRGAFENLEEVISPNELAGLACEPEVESRIVIEKGGAKPWECRYGPFQEGDFSQLPPSHWSLLVQGVDRLLPEVSALLGDFNFVPNWRLDDVMISYAPDGGSVGPHLDNYDVFLIQAHGKRLWQVGAQTRDDDDFIEDLDLMILKQFEKSEEWLLEPGDALYLPPRWEHHGVAQGEAMTWSVGFRAPSHKELIASFATWLMKELPEGPRYSDPDLTLQEHPGQITNQVIDRIQSIIQQATIDREAIGKWLGTFVTEPKQLVAEMEVLKRMPDQAHILEVKRRLQAGPLPYMEGIRVSWFSRGKENDLFVEGVHLPLPENLAGLAPVLADVRILYWNQIEPWWQEKSCQRLLGQFLAAGLFQEEDVLS